MESNIEMIRLLSGEYIIAELDSYGVDERVYLNPIQLVMMPPQQGQKEQMFGFAPFPPFAQPGSGEVSIAINTSAIAITMDVDDQFLAQYKEIFRKIVTPSSSLIIGK